MSELDPYRTGYMKPPKQSQFKKGKSGNPNGRPKQIEDPYLALQKVLKRKVQVKTDGRKISLDEALIRRLRDLAVSGDRRAIQMLQKILTMANDLNGADYQRVDLTAAKERLAKLCASSLADDSVDGGKDG
ncbi:DUF5681 domain-containing protein [uncultured Boseongicola sp.]|uniref:DUF5681 domain-containing protein n=1 Tax=uncultured Boseongicola sp. TaxID=1648499 RepID=UPI002613F21B|nr:DUF5681 domain-containing protein [uncultured Boseongicola sp.]